MTQPWGADTPAVQLSQRTKLEIYGAILLVLFLFALDQTVVGTALPVIITELGGNELYVWAVTVYLLTSTISGPIWGKLSDLFGRRPILLGAVALFIGASVGAGLSQEMWQFLLFRGLQGLGGGAVFPVALAVVADIFTPVERGKWLGLFGAVFGFSSVLGPWIGGLLTDLVSWNWIFFVNVPVGLVSFVVLWRLLPAVKRPEGARNIDYVGAAVFAAAIAPFLIGLTNKSGPPVREWTDPLVGGLMVLGLALGVLFIWIESRVQEPIVPLGLFRIRAVSISVLATFLVGFGFFGAIIFLPRWLQTVGGASATESGFNLLPLVGGMIIAAISAGQIVARTHRYKLMMISSLVLLAFSLFLMTNLRADTDRPVLWLWMVLAGIGIGPSLAVFTLVVQNAVAPQQIGAATSSVSFFQQIGGTIGLTIAGTVFGERFAQEVPPRLEAAGVPPEFASTFASGGDSSLDLQGTGDLGQRILASVPAEQQPFVEPLIPGIVGAIYDSVSIAIASSFWVGIAAAIVAVIVVVFIPEVPMRDTFEMEGAPSEHAEGSMAAG
jgi:EmrB/QacA subfamily drug resistance transporter